MMIQKIESDSNYTATVVNLPSTRPVKWLDNLVLATVFWYWCLVSKESKEWKYIFFPAETELSEEFLRENNLYRHEQKNKDTSEKGFFEDNGRVRAMKFKWVVSSWFLTPISCLSYLEDTENLKVWDEFHIINQHNICKKYRKPVLWSKKNVTTKEEKHRVDIVIPNQFRLHCDTPQFLKFIDDFNEWDNITITEKLHWTSAVFSNVLVKRKLGIIDRVARYFGATIQDKEYYPLYSSRKVIKNDELNDSKNINWYYGEDIWWVHAKLLKNKIEKGITIYGEIVWYTTGGGYIQQGYTYGCKEGESKFYVYRITYTSPDGVVIEFTDSQIRQYCEIRYILVVPLIGKTQWNRDEILEMIWDIEILCPLNNGKVPREGVVIRIDGKENYSAYKLKSQMFLTWETSQLDKDDSADLESDS